MKRFPNAKEAAKLKPEDLDLWFMEQELKEIRNQIFYAISKDIDYIIRYNIEECTFNFLKDQGYSVSSETSEFDTGIKYKISWGDVKQSPQREREIE